ncbi:quinolinate synthase NadA [Candidatus Poribacteria bacterium]|nr:quinolinate synthase NadA [Candidatus Poribacteria bacterium]
MEDVELQKKINALKEELNAIILVHNYQRDEVQDIADYLGDSLALSRKAASTDAKIIIFCGVYFMAETASILSPDKLVLIPEKDAGCPMADMITANELIKLKKIHPDAKVVCYVNSSAEVKAECDICCTSANAVQIVQSFHKEQKIIFVPDKNLGKYVERMTGRKLILWEGFCPTHEKLSTDDIKNAKKQYPNASVWSHPECSPEILNISDRILSTGGMTNIAVSAKEKEVIIATEMGMLHRLSKNNPDKKFYLASNDLICPNMKLISLESVLSCMKNKQYVVKVPEYIRIKAEKAISKMLTIG